MATQDLQSVHPIPPHEGTLPRAVLIRPLLHPLKDSHNCNLYVFHYIIIYNNTLYNYKSISFYFN